MVDLGYPGLGFVNLCVIYLFFGLGSLVSAPINRKFGHRLSLVVSSTTFFLWIAAFIIPAYKYDNYRDHKGPVPALFSDTSVVITQIFSAWLVGVGGGPLWVSQMCYVSECANAQTKGRYNSLFVSLYQVSSIVGSILTGQLIKLVNKTTFYLIMTCIGAAGTLFLMLLKPPIEQDEDAEEAAVRGDIEE